MKTSFLILAAAMFCVAISCEPNLENQINQLHAESRQVEKGVIPQLESLVQQSNGINVQGRALTADETEFTGKVATLQQTYAEWQKGMEDAEKMKPDQDRLNLETKLKDAILAFEKMVKELAPKPSF
ncbi:MAG: hypothetical protein AAB316_17485 [Bacteroidota bacterium]